MVVLDAITYIEKPQYLAIIIFRRSLQLQVITFIISSARVRKILSVHCKRLTIIDQLKPNKGIMVTVKSFVFHNILQSIRIIQFLLRYCIFRCLVSLKVEDNE